MTKRLDLPVEEMRCEYEEARHSTYAIGRNHGVSSSTISNRLHEAGVVMRPRGRRRGGRLFRETEMGYFRAHGRDDREHRIHRACWEAYNGPIPDKHDVHHINGGKLDNRIENLECLPHAEHTRMHHLGRRKTNAKD